MSAPAPTQQPAAAPGAPKPAAGPAPAGGAPAQQPAAGPGPAPATAPAPAPAAAGGDIVALKNRLKTEYPAAFVSDADFTFTKATSTAAQGFRFRIDRTKTEIKTRITPIGKKGGLLTPGFAHSTTPIKAPEVALSNSFNNQPVLKLKALPNPAGTHEVYNAELNATAAVGTVKVTQNGDIRSVAFTTAGGPATELVTATFFCPLAKAGCCSSPAPAKLNGIRFALGKAPRGVTIEENPNGDACLNDLEINVYFPEGIDGPNLIAISAVLQVVARELI